MTDEIRKASEKIGEQLRVRLKNLEKRWTASPVGEKTEEQTSSYVCSIKQGSLCLPEAMQYATSGGKRIRPLFLRAAYDSLQEDRTATWPESSIFYDLLCALECVHAYSLVHDDLPEMDNDDLRRGIPTVHKKFGVDMAVLCGDALLNFSQELCLHAILTTQEQELQMRMLHAAELLSSCAGLRGMIGGQMLDLAPDLLSDPEINHLMVLKKTGALFQAACGMGAILACGWNSNRVQEMTDLGAHVGMLFQLQDDLMDQEQDAREQKITFLSLRGKEWVLDSIRKEIRFIESTLLQLPNPDPLRFLVDRMVQRTY